MNTTYRKHTTCRYCDSGDLEKFLSLGDQPPSNSFIPKEAISQEISYPLDVYVCKNCFLVQLLDVVPAKVIFDDYLYLSSSSKALKNHYAQVCAFLTKRFKLKKGDVVVDIGCNDGILLDGYAADFVRVGVEPSKVAAIAKQHGYPVFQKFFDANVAAAIVKAYGHVSIATATNVFAHVDDIKSFVKGLPILLGDEGIFVIEAPYLRDLVDQTLFDTIYHEHLCYLSITPMVPFFAQFAMEIFHVERVAFGASGPALRIFVQKKSGKQKINASVAQILAEEKTWGVGEIKKYQSYAEKVERIKKDVWRLIHKIKKANKQLAGYGAPAKGSTLLNYFQLTSDTIAYIAETNTEKIGLVTPGSHIPIISEEAFIQRMPDYALLLTWNYLDFFLEKSDYIKKGGKFLVPLPNPVIVP